MRTVLSRGLLVGLVVAVALGAAATLQAQEPSYEGTYAGVVTTNTGRKVPIVVYARGEGDQAVLTLGAEGYTVRVADAETWEGEQMLLSPSVPAIYAAILSGDGNISFVGDGERWTATGSGTGTALDRYAGSAEGSAERVSADMDPEAAVAWHLANPVEGSPPPFEQRAQLIKTVEGVAALAAPAKQAPLADVEQTQALALIGLYAAIMLILMFIFFGPKLDVDELARWFEFRVQGPSGNAAPATVSPKDGGEQS
ncbi:MAG: hypothetical protein U1E26_08420 [Coriobacteriia bacterium]|nr:hypothetical protein [Coriobacteriia bacterium]